MKSRPPTKTCLQRPLFCGFGRKWRVRTLYSVLRTNSGSEGGKENVDTNFELAVKHTGVDSNSYILGIHAFVHGNGHNLRPKTLGAASFWAGLRQEIYTATMNQQPVKAPLVSSLVDGSRELGPADEEDWANRAVVHCIDVLNFCFGDEPPRQTWDELYAWNERWTASLPPSYTPTLDMENGPGEAFPEVWYHDTWQGACSRRGGEEGGGRNVRAPRMLTHARSNRCAASHSGQVVSCQFRPQNPTHRRPAQRSS